MDAFNLKTASTYLNNLLLARGLLRNGKSIEFARPSKGEGGSEATMAQIINLVHDMILRRDVWRFLLLSDISWRLMTLQREQEQRESLAETLRTLRSENTKHIQNIDRLETRNDDLTRQISLASSQERAARTALRSVEAAAKALREEMARMKGTVQQIRTSCANDIRKRDVQIQRLKTHLTAQQRGNKTGLVGASITIIPGATGVSAGNSSRSDESPDVDDPEYSLRQETTEFLTQLSQSLSDENDNLIGLVRSTLATLKDLQGIPENAERAGLADIPEDQTQDPNMLQALPASYESLATDMHNVLENLRLLLTNPNFVSIEEVSAREEEILRLREGFEKLEVRWREAVALMDGWRKRLLNGGDTVNIEELKQGLGLGRGFGASVALRDDLPDDSEADEEPSFDEPAGLADIEEMPTLDESVDLVPAVIPNDGKVKETSTKRRAQPLQEGTGNSFSPRKPDTKQEKTKVSPATRKEAEPERVSRRSQQESASKTKQSSTTSTKDKDSRIPRKVRFSISYLSSTPSSPARSIAEDDETSNKENEQHHLLNRFKHKFIDPLQTLKRLSSPHPHAEERSSKRSSSPQLTTQEKLNIAQAEAEAAAVAAGLEVDDLDFELEGVEKDEVVQTEKEEVKSRARKDLASHSRKTKIGGRPKRRKSTLTPEELESLMFVT
jgi:hypothetical protein